MLATLCFWSFQLLPAPASRSLWPWGASISHQPLIIVLFTTGNLLWEGVKYADAVIWFPEGSCHFSIVYLCIFVFFFYSQGSFHRGRKHLKWARDNGDVFWRRCLGFVSCLPFPLVRIQTGPHLAKVLPKLSIYQQPQTATSDLVL